MFVDYCLSIWEEYRWSKNLLRSLVMRSFGMRRCESWHFVVYVVFVWWNRTTGGVTNHPQIGQHWRRFVCTPTGTVVEEKWVWNSKWRNPLNQHNSRLQNRFEIAMATKIGARETINFNRTRTKNVSHELVTCRWWSLQNVYSVQSCWLYWERVVDQSRDNVFDFETEWCSRREPSEQHCCMQRTRPCMHGDIA